MHSVSDSFLTLLKQAANSYPGGVRSFEKTMGLKKWFLRGTLDPSRHAIPSIKKAEKICHALGLEFYIGPPREINPLYKDVGDPEAFAEIPLHDAFASAGDGAENPEVKPVAAISFPRPWLHKIGASTTTAALLYVRGESMEPTLKNRALIMIKKNHDWEGQLDGKHIFVYREGGENLVKRLFHQDGAIMVASDNPNYPPHMITDLTPDNFQIIGQVIWTAHGVG